MINSKKHYYNYSYLQSNTWNTSSTSSWCQSCNTSPHIKESGKFLLPESWTQEIFTCGILNPGNSCFKNPESRKVLLVESGTLDFEIQKTAQGIQNPSNNWNPGSTFHWQRIRNPVPGISNPCWGIRNPRLSWIPLHKMKHEQNLIYLRYIVNK